MLQSVVGLCVFLWCIVVWWNCLSACLLFRQGQASTLNLMQKIRSFCRTFPVQRTPGAFASQKIPITSLFLCYYFFFVCQLITLGTIAHCTSPSHWKRVKLTQLLSGHSMSYVYRDFQILSREFRNCSLCMNLLCWAHWSKAGLQVPMDLLHPDFSLELMRFNLLLPHWRMEHKCYNKLHSTEMCSLYIHTS